MSVQGISPTSLSSEVQEQRARQDSLVRRLNRNNALAASLLWLITAIVGVFFVAIVIYLIWAAFPAFIRGSFYGTDDAGVLPELFNTFYILILAELFLFPISLAAAIYMVEYTTLRWLVNIIHFAAETLSGVPSLVLGMFGFLFFSVDLHMGVSRLSGALTMLCLNFPLALRLFEEALNNVSREQREGALALGATRWRAIRTVVIPSALPGIITGLILTAGKIVGEAAALIYTMGLVNPNNVFTLNPQSPSDTLTTHLYDLAVLNGKSDPAVTAGIAGTLIVLLLVINLGARAVGRQIQRKLTAA